MHTSPYSKAVQLAGLIVWFVLCFGAAAVGAIGSAQAGTFYAELNLPDWAPPAAAFGPVWTVLYALMAVAAWLVWRARSLATVRAALGLFLAQLAVNALWSWTFFAWKQGGFAFLNIIVLWALIVATIAAFWRVRVLAGALLLPYLLWVSFAAALNWSIWRLNPQLLS